MSTNYRQKELFDGFIPEQPKLTKDGYFTVKEFTMARGLYLDRRILGACASASGNHLRISPKPKDVGNSHVVNTWPLSVLELAYDVYCKHISGDSEQMSFVDVVGGIHEQ